MRNEHEVKQRIIYYKHLLDSMNNNSSEAIIIKNILSELLWMLQDASWGVDCDTEIKK